MRLIIVGMPNSLNGPVSTASPLSDRVLALNVPMYWSERLLTTAFPSGWPVYPKPQSFVLPRSSSKATIWFLSQYLWASTQAWAPFLGSPHSSPLHAMNLIVLLGFRSFLRSNLIASKHVINPPPSSLAPVCDPVSQESMCPPISKISSGFSLPLISKMRLFEYVLGQVWLDSFNSRVIFCLRACIRSNISASSTVIAAKGILGQASLQCIIPVCTDSMESDATERTNAATAPYFAARQAPEERYCTLSPQVVQGWLQTTIFPFISSFLASSSSQLVKTMASALTLPETVPAKPITWRGVATGRGEQSVRDSLPLSHLVKFFTASKCTLSNPSVLAILQSSSITCSKASDPHSLGPQVSEIQANLSYALWQKIPCGSEILFLRRLTVSVQSFS